MTASTMTFSPGSDELAHKLRTLSIERDPAAGPLANCVLPILEALNWRGNLQDVVEALPHFADEIDLVDIRNAFVCLGYDSHASDTVLGDIDRRLLPCLFVRHDTDEIVPVLGYNERGLSIGSNGHVIVLPAEEAQIEGTAHYFTAKPELLDGSDGQVTDWFGRAVARFQSAFKKLIGVTFVTHVLATLFPLFIMFIYDRVIGGASPQTLPYVIFGVVIVLSADLIFRLIRSRVIGYVAGRLDYLLGVSTFKKILSLPAQFTERAAVSVQLARIREFESLRDFFTGPLVNAVLELPFVLLMIAVIWLIAGNLAFVPLVTMAAFIILGMIWLPASRRVTAEAGQASARREDLLVESLINMRSIKELGGESTWRERFRLASSQAAYTKCRSETNVAVRDAVSHALMMLSGLAILGFGTMGVLAGSITIGALIATMMLSWRVLTPLQTCFLAYTKLDQIKRSVKQINNLMRLKPEGHTGKSKLLSQDYDGDIVLNRVSYRYSAETDPALLGVNLRVNKGELVTVMGPTGSGKSTILKVIAGLYQPQGGTVSIGGLDLRQVDPRDLRRRIGYVPQQPQVFHGTIAQNLRLANPLASDDDLQRVADQVGLVQAIESLPKGLSTRIGLGQSDGLPPGLMQRVSIARALLRDPALLLLDEPAQALDNAGDEVLVGLLNSLRGHKTIVMVSHRPSHIRMSDRAVLVNRGVVEFEGAPDQALELAKLFGNQHRIASNG